MNPLADKFFCANLCMLYIMACKRSKIRHFRHVLKMGHNKKILSPDMGKRGFMNISKENNGRGRFYRQ